MDTIRPDDQHMSINAAFGVEAVPGAVGRRPHGRLATDRLIRRSVHRS